MKRKALSLVLCPALELSLIFAFRLRWLPPTGFKDFRYIILPVITLGLGGAASNYRMARSTVLDEIRKPD